MRTFSLARECSKHVPSHELIGRNKLRVHCGVLEKLATPETREIFRMIGFDKRALFSPSSCDQQLDFLRPSSSTTFQFL